jgi:hypothetical protein
MDEITLVRGFREDVAPPSADAWTRAAEAWRADAGERRQRSYRAPRRPRGLFIVVGVVVALLALALGGFVLARGGDRAVRVESGVPATEVKPSELSEAQSDVVVFMAVAAPSDQIEAIRALLASSPDVRVFSVVDRRSAYQEFAAIYCDQPDLVDSIRADDLPVSFRIAAVDADALTRLETALAGAPGVTSVRRSAELETPAPAACPPSDGREGEATPALPTPSTTLPTLPPTDGPQPIDPDAARDAVVAAFMQAYTGSNSVETRRAAMQDSDVLKPQLDQARAANTEAVNTMTITVGEVTFVDETHAALIYHLTISGVVYPDTLGYAVLDGGSWKVSRATTCAILELAAVQCPPG